VATLALTYMIPPESLRCGLEDKWHKMYRDKSARQIRGIQDGLNCCGYKRVHDMAWPFLPKARKPGNCAETTGRSQLVLLLSDLVYPDPVADNHEEPALVYGDKRSRSMLGYFFLLL
jgi:hypothetical protein